MSLFVVIASMLRAGSRNNPVAGGEYRGKMRKFTKRV